MSLTLINISGLVPELYAPHAIASDAQPSLRIAIYIFRLQYIEGIPVVYHGARSPPRELPTHTRARARMTQS
jgi:hypothetical protein